MTTCYCILKNFTKEVKAVPLDNPTKYTTKLLLLLSVIMDIYFSPKQCYYSCHVSVDLFVVILVSCIAVLCSYISSLHLLDNISSIRPPPLLPVLLGYCL